MSNTTWIMLRTNALAIKVIKHTHVSSPSVTISKADSLPTVDSVHSSSAAGIAAPAHLSVRKL